MGGLRKLAAFEPAALFFLVMGYIWIWRRSHPYWWIAILACLLLSHVLHRESARQLGFGRQSLEECAHRFAPLLIVLALAMFGGGLLLNTTRRIPTDQAFLALFAYLPWGLLQQYMLNGYFLRGFDRAFPPRESEWLTAVLFGVAHTPNWFLMTVALTGGWCAIKVYRRHRNLYFLGIAHATIGFLLYVTVPDSISHHLEVGPGMLHRHVVRAIK
ncbi:MAG TPA: CPBP family intramembrane glutamic endopeptidase [Bryobacteraceae bacterium]|nr:CPBP family intramembrane glutamic endopeptidase [Bryobacteraceae bacterium]